MNLVAPIGAMLWENWRLTRVEAAQRFSVGIIGGAGALILFNSGAAIAFWILMAVHSYFWFSIAKLNGGRLADGYKPGFPLYLLYTRPVPTPLFVGTAMLYDAVSCTALYVVSAMLLGIAFGKPLPLFSVAVLLLSFHLACTCIQWSTRSRVIQWTGSIVLGWPLFFLLFDRVKTPLQVEFSPVEIATLLVVGVVSIALTIPGVARQRRGDAVVKAPRAEGSFGYPDWLVSLLRFPCPTSSATRAQVWFELKSSGLPVLLIGLATSLLVLVLFALGIVIPSARWLAVPAVMFSIPVVLFLLGGNAFGIRRKQGHTYASAFEATQPLGTSKTAALKILVRAACVLTALTALGASVWISTSFVSKWGSWVVQGGHDAVPGLLQMRGKLEGLFAGAANSTLAAQGVLVAIGVAGIVAWQATREALRAHFGRRVLLADWMTAIWGVSIGLLTLAKRKGIAVALPLDGMIWTIFWTGVLAVVVTTIYLSWRGLAERALTLRYLGFALVITAVFGFVWLITLEAAGVRLAEKSAMGIAAVLFPALLILMDSVLSPWSLGRVRHA